MALRPFKWPFVVAAGLAASVAACPGDGSFETAPPVPEVPTEPRALYEFLAGRRYQAFEGESAPHPPAGPHGRMTRVYLNPTLVQSLTEGNASHPRGSAAVKEVFDADGMLGVWAVMVKQRDGADGTAWYWYETGVSPDKADNPDYAGDGTGSCSPCHSEGQGFIRIQFPLR